MPNNLIIYSVPKSGTHFLSQIVALLLDPDCNIYEKFELYKHVAHCTRRDFNDNSQLNRPYFNTHPGYLSYDSIKSYPHTKIFVVRNPLDKIVSSYFYRIYYRADPERLSSIKANLNKHMFDYCLGKIEVFSHQVMTHIEMSKVIENAELFDYGTVFEDKRLYIRRIAELMAVPVNDDLVEYIYNKTDIKKCSEYESRHRSFNVGAIQNGLFFRQGGTNNYKKYLHASQIDKLKNLIPQYLRNFYNL